jgi:nucleotidyltransferase/DNA polymerase involved in DNA repair
MPGPGFREARFEVYKEISRHIRAIFAEHTEIIEPLSLDEAYLDVTENIQGIPIATEIATMIRAKILSETDLTASAGISYNKFLAKLASDHASRTDNSSLRQRWVRDSFRISPSANSMGSARRPARK